VARKFANYRGIDSLMGFCSISQDKIKVEHYVKQPMAIAAVGTLRPCGRAQLAGLSAPR